MNYKLPIPKEWQNFETICHRLWRDIWNDPNTQKNGRNGQNQAGVDVFGKPIYEENYHGIQCKDKDQNLGSQLTENEISKEANNALKFRPFIRNFTIATTAPRDQKFQQFSRVLSEEQKFPFEINVWSWDDIESEIIFRPQIMNNFYPHFSDFDQFSKKVILNKYSSKDHLYAYFTRPHIKTKISSQFKDYILPIIYEFSDNSYKYGNASFYEIKVENNSIKLIDNGKEFNPLKGLDGTKVNKDGYVGSYIFDVFQKKFSEYLSISYDRIQDKNILEISGDSKIFLLEDDEGKIYNIDLVSAFGRENAKRYANTIDLSKKRVRLNLGHIYNVSAAVEFTKEILILMERNQKLEIFIKKHAYLGEMESWLEDDRLKVIEN